jgi:pimeloyl-ACP methyl ester carboxylesterase
MAGKMLALISRHINFSSMMLLSELPSDYLLSFEEICVKLGYCVQSYWVTTEDGYILRLFRLGKGKFSQGTPVLLVHGMTQTSTSFIMCRSATPPALALVNENFDVWLLNTRGNYYSRMHTKLKPEDKQYWEWTAYDISVKDIPTTIDYILEFTGYKKLNYMGNSQGGHVLLNCLAFRPEYNDKINLASLLSPVGGTLTVTSKSFNYLIHPLNTSISLKRKKYMVSDYCPTGDWTTKIAYNFPYIAEILSKDSYDVSITGDSNSHLSYYSQHSSGGTSVFNCKYFYQLSKNKNPHPLAYDFGNPQKNNEKYGSPVPPRADYSKISAKIALFYGKYDKIVSPKDGEILFTQMNKGNVVFKQFDCDLDHAGFVVSSNQDHILKTIELMRLHEISK